MLNYRICLAQMGSTENRSVTNKTDVCLENYSFEAEQITVLNLCCSLLIRYLQLLQNC